MAKVFVCCPVRETSSRSVEQHLRDAETYANTVRLLGHRPIVPHLWLVGHLIEEDPDERAMGMAMDKEALRFCDELWAFGGRVSGGMATEIEYAKERKIPGTYCWPFSGESTGAIWAGS